MIMMFAMKGFLPLRLKFMSVLYSDFITHWTGTADWQLSTLCSKTWTGCQTNNETRRHFWGGSGWRFNLRIRSVPGNNTLPRTISAMMQPTDQTSTEKWNDNHQISMQDWKADKKLNKGKSKNRCNVVQGDVWYRTKWAACIGVHF